MDGVTCPIDGCDYQGTPRSVEAHISGAMDEAHSGEVGRAYRGRFGEIEEGEELTAPSEDRGDDVEASEPAGVPIPVSSTVLLVAIAVVVFVLVLRSRRGGSSSEESDQRRVMQ